MHLDVIIMQEENKNTSMVKHNFSHANTFRQMEMSTFWANIIILVKLQ